jgi:hypothetical protein
VYYSKKQHSITANYCVFLQSGTKKGVDANSPLFNDAIKKAILTESRDTTDEYVSDNGASV